MPEAAVRRMAGAAAAMMFLGVALGAFGAHGLRARLSPEMMAIYQTGVQYHLVHGLSALLAAALAERLANGGRAIWAARCFLAGVFIFSGSLYALALTGVRALGAITPLGGIAFLLGWALLTSAALSRPRR